MVSSACDSSQASLRFSGDAGPTKAVTGYILSMQLHPMTKNQQFFSTEAKTESGGVDNLYNFRTRVDGCPIIPDLQKERYSELRIRFARPGLFQFLDRFRPIVF